MARRGLIKFVKYGRARGCRVHVDPDDIDRLIEESKQHKEIA